MILQGLRKKSKCTIWSKILCATCNFILKEQAKKRRVEHFQKIFIKKIAFFGARVLKFSDNDAKAPLKIFFAALLPKMDLVKLFQRGKPLEAFGNQN